VTPMSLVAAVAPCKIIKNVLNFLQRREVLLQNGILHFVFRLSQWTLIALESCM